NDSGSTIGLTKVVNGSGLPSAFEKALNESGNILVEKFIKGREITATVLDGKAYPLVEIIPENELYDYEAKYTEGKSHYEVPAKVDDEMVQKIQHDAVKIYNIIGIGASGLARVDFILDEKNNHYFLELNTLPGMTPLSLAPMAAKAVGIEFDDLIDRLIKTALERECG
ncbi:MAG: D-alanine--D-alanine ligase, partial [FCB group bacterium]|nr:D-alanine--D-alanine ligase [FCB group bacterium]